MIWKVAQCLRYNLLCLTGASASGLRETAVRQGKIVKGYSHQIFNLEKAFIALNGQEHI